MSVLYRNHKHPIRSLDQVTGANVVPFPPRREPWPYEKGAEPPKFLRNEDTRNTSTNAN